MVKLWMPAFLSSIPRPMPENPAPMITIRGEDSLLIIGSRSSN
jgi:hypothetical protein